MNKLKSLLPQLYEPFCIYDEESEMMLIALVVPNPIPTVYATPT